MEFLDFNNHRINTEQILVFRSNIDNSQKARLVCNRILKMDGVLKANVDLDDWENIVRVVCDERIRARQIEKEAAQLGFFCTELED